MVQEDFLNTGNSMCLLREESTSADIFAITAQVNENNLDLLEKYFTINGQFRGFPFWLIPSPIFLPTLALVVSVFHVELHTSLSVCQFVCLVSWLVVSDLVVFPSSDSGGRNKEVSNA